MNSITQFVKFMIVGSSNTIIGFTIYYLLLWFGAHYLWANTISWIISVFNAFFWNNRYVFQNESHWLRALLKTYISYLASLLLGLVLMYILVDIWNISEIIAPIITLFITMPINFCLNKFWTFKNKRG